MIMNRADILSQLNWNFRHRSNLSRVDLEAQLKVAVDVGYFLMRSLESVTDRCNNNRLLWDASTVTPGYAQGFREAIRKIRETVGSPLDEEILNPIPPHVEDPPRTVPPITVEECRKIVAAHEEFQARQARAQRLAAMIYGTHPHSVLMDEIVEEANSHEVPQVAACPDDPGF